MPDTPNDKRKQKKSETLEVRLPYETKQAFLTACREDGTTASEVVRTSIDTYLESGRPAPQPETGNVLAMIPKPLRRPRLALGAAGAIGLVAMVALPSAAAPDLRSAFQRLDTNHDGVISVDEFTAGGQSGKSVSTQDGASVVLSMRRHDGDGPLPAPSAPVTSNQEEAYTFWLPEVDGKGGGGDAQYNVIQHNEIRIQTDGHDTAAAPASDEPQIKRSFRMCTKTAADKEPVCTESGDPPADIKAMTFNLADMRKSEFVKYDTDGDGRVSFAEYQARQTAMLTRGFQILDQNSDGSLSQEEYARIVSPPVPGHGAASVAGTIALSNVTLGGPAKYTPEVLKAAFQKLDKNGDGKLSLQEYLPQS